MGNVIIDFRFSSINYELWALSQYLNLMERHLSALAQSERERIKEEFSLPAGESRLEEYSFGLQMADDIEDRILPRLFLAPFVISLWSVFESGVIEVGEYIRQQKEIKIKLNDLRGDFLTRVQRYFNDVISYDLCLGNDCWDKLRDLVTVRNAIAHANGRLSAIKKSDSQRIERIVHESEGLKISDGLLIPSIPFVRKCYKDIFLILDDLLNRVRTGFSDLFDD